eukprot:1847862-Heterocapsa_arctica.AAC.1
MTPLPKQFRRPKPVRITVPSISKSPTKKALSHISCARCNVHASTSRVPNELCTRGRQEETRAGTGEHE